MEKKIKFVRVYESYGEKLCDIVYHSGRLHAYRSFEDVPTTVKKYIENAPYVTKQYDKTFNRHETLYSFTK